MDESASPRGFFSPIASLSSSSSSVSHPIHNYSSSDRKLPVAVHIRKNRLVLFVLVVYGPLIAILIVFGFGVNIHKIDGSLPNQEKQLIVDDYNFYSGTIASVLSEPAQWCLSMLMPVLQLLAASHIAAIQTSRGWKLLLFALQTGMATMLGNAFNSINVQEQSPKVFPAIAENDLLSIDALLAAKVSSTDIHPLQEQPTTETMLRTAMLPTFVKDQPNPCDGGGEWVKVGASYSFHSNSWLRKMLPFGRSPIETLSIDLMSILSGEKGSDTSIRSLDTLPFSQSTGASLLLHSMLLSQTLLSFAPLSGLVNSSYDSFLDVAKSSVELGEIDTHKFLLAAAKMVNDTLSWQKDDVPVDLTQVEMNMSHSEISSGIIFDATTLTLPSKPNMFRRKLRITDTWRLIEDDISDNELGNDANATYEIDVTSECSGDSVCLIKHPGNDTNENRQRTVWGAPPQIHALALCANATLDTDYFRGGGCTEQSNTSMLVYSFARRIVADDFYLETEKDHPYARKAVVVNARQYWTITVGKLHWDVRDLSRQFNAACTSTSCNGLNYQLEGNSSQQLVVGDNHLPLKLLGMYEGSATQWTPLATISQPLDGDLLFLRNVKSFASSSSSDWPPLGWPCSKTVHSVAERITRNYWIMEYGFQEAYTAAMFFLFQNAALRDTATSVDGQADTLNFVGSTVEISLRAHIPLQSVLISACTSIFLILVASAVSIYARHRQPVVPYRVHSHQVAGALVMGPELSEALLQCSIPNSPHSAATLATNIAHGCYIELLPSPQKEVPST